MNAVAGFFLSFVPDVLIGLAYFTARILFWTVSFGRIRVQSFPDAAADEPEFGWHNVIWKWDGKTLWVAHHVALLIGIFLWFAALTALVYFWRSFG